MSHDLVSMDLHLAHGRAMCSCGQLSVALASDQERLQWHRQHVRLMVIADRDHERRHPLDRFNHWSGIRPIINVYLPGDGPTRR